MLASAPVVSFVPATDLGRARQFYESVLGLPVVHADGIAVVVSSSTAVIRITDVGKTLRPQPFTILGWQVDDLDAEIDALAAQGVEFARYPGLEQDERGAWTTPDGGTRVAWFHDPDGNTLSLDSHAG